MNSKQLKLVPIGLVLALGAGQAVAESTWYHNSNGALVINVDGSRSAYTGSNQPVKEAVAPAGRWYHDSNGALVINVEGSRSKFSRSNVSTENTLSTMQSWFHDEDSDTIVYNVAGSRSGYQEDSSSM